MQHHSPITSILKVGLVVIALLGIAACSSLRFPGVYRISIHQGNLLDQDKVDQVKKGMTRRQVQFLLGTPLVQDTFNQDLWIYFYHLRSQKGKVTEQRLEITFEEDKVASFKGDILPRSEEEIAEAEKKREEAIAKRKEAYEKHKKAVAEGQKNKKEPHWRKKGPIRANRGPTR